MKKNAPKTYSDGEIAEALGAALIYPSREPLPDDPVFGSREQPIEIRTHIPVAGTEAGRSGFTADQRRYDIRVRTHAMGVGLGGIVFLPGTHYLRVHAAELEHIKRNLISPERWDELAEARRVWLARTREWLAQPGHTLDDPDLIPGHPAMIRPQLGYAAEFGLYSDLEVFGEAPAPTAEKLAEGERAAVRQREDATETRETLLAMLEAMKQQNATLVAALSTGKGAKA